MERNRVKRGSEDRDRFSIKSKKLSNYDEIISSLPGIDYKEFFYIFINHLKEDHKLSSKDVIDLFTIKVSEKIRIPVSVFDNGELSALETIVKYLKEELDLGYHKIALLLNRNDRTIWTTYNKALKKRKEKLTVKETRFFIPISIFKNRRLSVLEALVSYLKDEYKLSYHEISILINRDQRNVWTVYDRRRRKK